MFVAHLPAGYLGTRAFLRLFKKPAACRGDSSKDKDLTPKFFLAVGLLGSVFPDLDLIYFYTLDHRQHLHHSYWVHIPVYWLAVFGLGWLGCSLFRRPTLVLYFAVFCANVFLHLFLDTLVGQIKWLYPFSNRYLYFFDVPAKLGPSMWNFIFHWSFLLELAVVFCAAWTFWGDKRGKKKNRLMSS